MSSSAYDLFLTGDCARALSARASMNASADLFFAQRLDAGGATPLLVAVADTHPGTRVVSGQFTEIRQAIGTPHGRPVPTSGLRPRYPIDGVRGNGDRATAFAASWSPP